MSLDTRGIDPQRLLPQSLEDRLLGWLSRMGGVTLLVGLTLVWASLATWSVLDPSLTHATANVPRNLLGPLGAIVSDLLLQTFGLAAVLALLAPMYWSAELISERRIVLGRTKLGFYPLSVLAIAGGLSSLPIFGAWPLHHGFGGAIGDGLFKLVANLLAIINADRADMASGLVLILGAIASTAKSVGLDIEGWIQDALKARKETAINRAREGIEARQTDPQPSLLDRWRQSRAQPKAANTASKSPFGAAAELAVPSVGGTAWPSQAGAWMPAQAPPVGRHLPAQSADLAPSAPGAPLPAWDFGTPHLQDSPAEFLADHALSPPFAAPLAASSSRSQALVFRGATFDASTDAASQAIARRFAPVSIESGIDQAMDSEPAVEPNGYLANISRRKGEIARQWKRPSLNLLKRAPAAKPGPELSQTVMRGNARLLEDVLNDFGVKGEVKDIKPGPVVTLYELEPARGTKSSRVIGLADDIARSMSVVSVRAAVVPGRNAIGLELPNMRRESVLLREMLESEAYKTSDAILPITLGKSIGGEPVVADLARMPHLLVAGTTGSGKSVGVNAFILSLLYRHSPNECRFLMIDPKMLELSVYNGIPHLLTPVVTDPHKAVVALNWAVSEMEERYKRMSTLSVRNIDVFNNRVRNAQKRGELLSRTVQTGFDKSGQAIFEKQKMDLEPMARIVIVVDEFADLMCVAGKEVEAAVQRLAQMARAAGIHLIMATQRPSVDVITGTIKANFPTRISFKVTSKIDSRTILNEQGAEQLLGQGDMLYSSGAGQIVRVHGAFVADDEVEAIADALRQQGGPQYIEGILDGPNPSEIPAGERESSSDDLYDRAVAIVVRDRKASTSYIQRRLQIGYNRAADLIERMEREGLISPANSVGKREILASGSSADAA